MFLINNENWELPQIGKTPKIGYEYEYITKTALSGKTYRTYIGRRFVASISYAFLTAEQIEKIMEYAKSVVDIEIRTPIDTFEGKAQITITNMPSRFDTSETSDTWTGWTIDITGESIIQ